MLLCIVAVVVVINVIIVVDVVPSNVIFRNLSMLTQSQNRVGDLAFSTKFWCVFSKTQAKPFLHFNFKTFNYFVNCMRILALFPVGVAMTLCDFTHIFTICLTVCYHSPQLLRNCFASVNDF